MFAPWILNKREFSYMLLGCAQGVARVSGSTVTVDGDRKLYSSYSLRVFKSYYGDVRGCWSFSCSNFW